MHLLPDEPTRHAAPEPSTDTGPTPEPGLEARLEPGMAQHTPEVMLLRLFASLDTSPDDANAMRQILDTITAVVPCAHAIFYEWRTLGGGQFEVTRAASTNQALLKDYLAHARAVDPCVEADALEQCIHSARSQTLADFAPPETQMNLPFVRTFLERHERLQHALCHHAAVSSGHYTSLHLFRGADQPTFTPEEQACLDHVHAHVVLWLRQRWANRIVQRERDALQAALDLHVAPVFLLDTHAHLVACNQRARRLLQDGWRMRLIDNVLLPGSQMDHASWLTEASERLLSAADPASSQTWLQPLPASQSRSIRHYGVLAAVSQGANTHAAAMILTLIDTQLPAARHSPAELRRVFGFTGAEARIADALLAGMGTAEISEAFGIRRDTARSHIKRLLAKTGTRGNTELQKLLLRLAPDIAPLQRKPPSVQAPATPAQTDVDRSST